METDITENMGSAERRELLLKKILRYDFYLNTVNLKASVIISWNGVLIGVVLLKHRDLIDMFAQPLWAYYFAGGLIAAIALMSTISIFLSFSVIYPFLDSGRKDFKSPSLFFFGDVASLCLEKYIQMERQVTSDEILVDLGSQAHVLAKGLHDKMTRLQKCAKAIIGGVICIVMLIVLKIVISLLCSVN